MLPTRLVKNLNYVLSIRVRLKDDLVIFADFCKVGAILYLLFSSLSFLMRWESEAGIFAQYFSTVFIDDDASEVWSAECRTVLRR